LLKHLPELSSMIILQAEKDVPYTLNVLTDKGTSYVSRQKVCSVGQNRGMYAERDFNVDGEEGVIYLFGWW